MRSIAYFPKPEGYPRAAVILPPAVLGTSPASVRVVRGYVGQRVRWRGCVNEVVAIPPMLRLGAVSDESGVAVWDCLWLNYTKHLQALILAEGDVLEFVARVDKLLDGSYILNRPLKAQRIEA